MCKFAELLLMIVFIISNLQDACVLLHIGMHCRSIASRSRIKGLPKVLTFLALNLGCIFGVSPMALR